MQYLELLDKEGEEREATLRQESWEEQRFREREAYAQLRELDNELDEEYG